MAFAQRACVRVRGERVRAPRAQSVHATGRCTDAALKRMGWLKSPKLNVEGGLENYSRDLPNRDGPRAVGYREDTPHAQMVCGGGEAGAPRRRATAPPEIGDSSSPEAPKRKSRVC